MKTKLLFISIIFFSYSSLQSQIINIGDRLNGFDQYMENILKDWNAPGVGVGVVYKDSLIFSKGYGYRDYEKKLPITPNTLFQIASNTKLFTTTALGFLVEEDLLQWDKPIKNFVPSIEFSSQTLNEQLTLRDMLAHRAGISRHDMIWYQSDFTRKELFNKLKYLEASIPIRENFMYNNLMYVAAGYIIELLTEKTWEEYITQKIFDPIGMNNTVFTLEDMFKSDDYFVPYNEKRDTTILSKIPHYEDKGAVGPAGSIISNINDLSKWVITQMHSGVFKGEEVILPKIIEETMIPSINIPNKRELEKGYFEMLCPSYGMGRFIAAYKGHLITFHGGALDGIYSQVSFMPNDSVGVIVFTIGRHTAPLTNVVSYNVYERMLNIEQTPWSERRLSQKNKNKKAYKEARSKEGITRIENTKPSHKLDEYIGQYSDEAFGNLSISIKDEKLHFDFRKINLPLEHYHYDRFETPNDEVHGKWAVNFLTNPQGDIDKIKMMVYETEVTFLRKPDESMLDPKVLKKYLGKYSFEEYKIEIELKNQNKLVLYFPGEPEDELIPYKIDKFKMEQYKDVLISFVKENNKIIGFDLIVPSGVYKYTKLE